MLRENSPSMIIEADDQEMLFKGFMMIRALIAGFSLEESRRLLDPENYLIAIPLNAHLPPRDMRKKSGALISRLESFDSLNLRVIMNFTGVASRFHDGSIWLLGPAENIQEASREVRQIVMGRTRGTVQQFHREKHRIIMRRRKRAG